MLNRFLKKLYNFKATLEKKISFRLIKKEIAYLEKPIEKTLVIGTKRGLFILDENILYQILYGTFYGITFHKKKTYVFEKLKNNGRIISFKNNFKAGDKFEVIIDDLSPGCHQIDFIGEKLFVTDTYNNCISIYTDSGIYIDKYYPLGQLSNGRKSDNYGHINSIFFYKDHVYLICHNETAKTGKKSELLKLSKELKLLEKIKLNASSAHNIIINDSNYYICDSLNSRLIVNNEGVFECDLFTRGLAIFEDKIFMGGSEYAEREKRKSVGGALFILNKQFEELKVVELPAMVQEIRGIKPHDLSLSNYRQ